MNIIMCSLRLSRVTHPIPTHPIPSLAHCEFRILALRILLYPLWLFGYGSLRSLCARVRTQAHACERTVRRSAVRDTDGMRAPLVVFHVPLGMHCSAMYRYTYRRMDGWM